MKSVLILSFSTIKNDPRVMRQIKLLEAKHNVTVAGFGTKPDAGIDFISIDTPKSGVFQKARWAIKLATGKFDSYYCNLPHVIQAKALLSEKKFDLIISNDVSSLPLSLSLAKSNPVLLDAHEYSPREFEDNWRWKLFFSRYNHELCKKYLPEVSSMTTVCQGIADEYKREYGVSSRVVHNAPVYHDLSPSSVSSSKIRIIHHGGAIRSRKIETMIEMMKYLDSRFTLDFMLVDSSPGYMKELRSLAKGDSRIFFIDPVPMPEICTTINKFDIGLFLLPPVNFNYKYALPNKLFEFIQSRLAIAIGPSPEMADIVKKHRCGVVSNSFSPKELADMLNALDAEAVARLKTASDQAAAVLSYEASGKVMLEEIERVLQK